MEIMQNTAKLPAEIAVAGKDEAAQKLPDLFGPNAVAAQAAPAEGAEPAEAAPAEEAQ